MAKLSSKEIAFYNGTRMDLTSSNITFTDLKGKKGKAKLVITLGVENFLKYSDGHTADLSPGTIYMTEGTDIDKGLLPQVYFSSTDTDKLITLTARIEAKKVNHQFRRLTKKKPARKKQK